MRGCRHGATRSEARKIKDAQDEHRRLQAAEALRLSDCEVHLSKALQRLEAMEERLEAAERADAQRRALVPAPGCSVRYHPVQHAQQPEVTGRFSLPRQSPPRSPRRDCVGAAEHVPRPHAIGSVAAACTDTDFAWRVVLAGNEPPPPLSPPPPRVARPERKDYRPSSATLAGTHSSSASDSGLQPGSPKGSPRHSPGAASERARPRTATARVPALQGGAGGCERRMLAMVSLAEFRALDAAKVEMRAPDIPPAATACTGRSHSILLSEAEITSLMLARRAALAHDAVPPLMATPRARPAKRWR